MTDGAHHHPGPRHEGAFAITDGGNFFGWCAAVKAYSATEGDTRGNSCW